MTQQPVMLSIAGSDPSGGAGIQADLKTATAFGVYGGAVITALTAQNTHGVSGVFPVSAEFVVDQYEAVISDLAVRAVKIGMLGNASVVAALADALQRHRAQQGQRAPDVVLDPVMVATSGDQLVADDTVEAIRERLLPLATVVTPNLPEAAALGDGTTPTTLSEMAEAGQALRRLGAAAVLVKGGHGHGPEATDVLVDADGTTRYGAPRIDTANTHGTGCTLSSAIASLLTYPVPLREAVDRAKTYLTEALRSGAARHIGDGSGPVDHLWERR